VGVGGKLLGPGQDLIRPSAGQQQQQTWSKLIAHIATQEAEEDIATTYCRYLPIRIGEVSCAALLDSGNVWRSVISENFLTKLGLDRAHLRPIPHKSVGTAKTNSNLIILGELIKPLYINIAGLNTKMKIRPVVLEGLAMNINLSGPWMKMNNLDQIHSENAIRVMGRTVKLLTCPTAAMVTAIEVPTAKAYVIRDIQVPPQTQVFIPLRIPAVERREMPCEDGMIRGAIQFMQRTDLHPWAAGVVKCSKTGTISAGVLNTLQQPVTVKAGTYYGDYSLLCSPDEQHITPWRIATIAPQQQQQSTQPPNQGGHKTLAQKKEWLLQQFQLQSSPFLQNPADCKRAIQLLLEFWDVFSHEGEYGKTTMVQHDIVTENVVPVKCRIRPINPAMEGDLRKQMDKWREEDVIEPSTSPWSFPLLAAPKKDGSVRWCVDFRRLNDVTLKDNYPIPNMEDNLARLSRSKIFSAIDGAGAYHVVAINPRDTHKTAFSTPWGLFQFKRMPFGLCNAPATYCRLVAMVLNGIPSEMALPYLDDTAVHSQSLPDHFLALRRVLLAHRNAGLKLQPKKCHLFKASIQYLGHMITPEGLSPVKEYIDIVRNWPLPTTKTEARTFLGKCGYYRRFIPFYSALSGPWNSIMAKTTNEEEKALITHTPQLINSFEKLRKALIQAPVLAFPRFDSTEPFIPDTDWSQDHQTIGGVLSQIQDGQERVIAYGANKMSKSQRNYSANKGELCAIIHFCQKWKYYLQHRQFVLRTDHHSLKYIRSMEQPSLMTERWLETLANFNFEIKYRPGTQHCNADALSRVDHAPPIDFQFQVAAIQVPQFSPAEVRRLQAADMVLNKVRQWVKDKQQPAPLLISGFSRNEKIYAGLFNDLFLNDHDVLCRRITDDTNPVRRPFRICLPDDLQDEVIRSMHHQLGHKSADNTLARVNQFAYFPAAKKLVHSFVNTCLQCQAKKRNSRDQRHTLCSPQQGYPFQRISIDFVGPLSTSTRGNQYILSVKDTFTRWMEAFPIHSATAEETVRILEKEIICRYGIPEIIHSDQGRQFTSRLMEQVANT
jgi:hypothetical protein